ncbi:hypothetical protein G5B31_10950 [Rhodobacter sp. SGA-6-6]|uniref:hypothetical protein n=1 Tax=Rhodobacter sp. SGA-6-6 TaxID=2710882 RepID=UPI0013ED4D19|nr:hypothetical protein [Rhodobacter sp. SGA-6-6]NGM46057.1 hypothetical protein [Rhodobacter sp. SGA-6-6]
MAHANSRKFGPGQQDQGKGDGSGGMGAEETGPLPEILSNRDKSRHSEQRGLDSARLRAEQQLGEGKTPDQPPDRTEE